MPSYLGEAPGPTCWNCDREAGEAVAVTMRTPAGGEATFALCQACYADVYVPLADRLVSHGQAARLGGDMLVLRPPAGRSALA